MSTKYTAWLASLAGLSFFLGLSPDVLAGTCVKGCGRGGGGHVIEDEGTARPARDYLNFTGSGVTCSDDYPDTKCEITSGTGNFSTIGDCTGPTCLVDGTDDGSALVYEGASVDANETRLSFTGNPGADYVVTIPNETGTILTDVAPVTVPEGGTGVATLADGGLVIGNGAGVVEVVAAGDTTEILVGGGAGTAPAYGTDIPTDVTIGSAYIYRVNGIDVADADVVDTLTCSNYLPLAGGTLTGEVTVDNLGLEFTEGDDHSDCSAFSVTGGGIFYDDSEGVFKKCEDDFLSDLDTSASPSAISAGDSNVTVTDDGTGNVQINLDTGGSNEDLQIAIGAADHIDVTSNEGVNTLDFAMALEATTFTADPSDTPSFVMETLTLGTQTSLEMSDDVGPDGVLDVRVDIAGALDTWIHLDGVNNDIEIGDATNVGAVTFLTASTGDAEVVLPDDSVGASEILDDAVTAAHIAATVTFADDDLLDLSAINNSDGAEGLILPQLASACAAAIAEGQICWDTAGKGDGAAPVQMNLAAGGDISDVGDCATGAAFTGACGTTLTSNTDIILDLDDDNNGTEVFLVRDGADGTAMQVTEAGVLTLGTALADAQVSDTLTASIIDLEAGTITNIADAEILIGVGAGDASYVNPAGDVEIANDGTTTIQAGAVDPAMIAPLTKSMVWGAGAISTDGTECSDPAEVTIGTGPKVYTISCPMDGVSETNGVLYGSTVMPEGWDGGAVRLELTTYMTTDTDVGGTLHTEAQVLCRTDDESIDATWGAAVEIDLAVAVGDAVNEIITATSGDITGNGCAAGESLFWRIVWCDTDGTPDAPCDTSSAGYEDDLDILAVKMEYVWDPDDEP
jgi:hypothetical protein